MLQTLNIKQFRGIGNLNLGDLGQINIIAGRNNSGKTSILEIIESLQSPSVIYIWGFIGKRDNSRASALSVYETVDSLFSTKIHAERDLIEYSGEISNHKKFLVQIKRSVGKTLLDFEKAKEFGMIGNKTYDETENFDVDSEFMDIEYFINGLSEGKDTIYLGQKKFNGLGRGIANGIVENIVRISSVRQQQNSRFLNCILSKPVLYERFVKIMKRFDPDFIAINAIENNGGTKYMVLSKNHTKALTLDAYGDGMKKAMLLLGAVIMAQNGILLIDEFETAIHVSAMKHVFGRIIETAIELNVQIFMTSHSLEAIRAVLLCDSELQQAMRMLTLANIDGEIKVRNVDGAKAIQLLDEYGLELR